jgi:hypothetical protein
MLLLDDGKNGGVAIDRKQSSPSTESSSFKLQKQAQFSIVLRFLSSTSGPLLII